MKKNIRSKFHKLSNGQWLKIVFKYVKKENAWYFSIVVGDTKRKCNDALNKPLNSPKHLFHGEVTGKKSGIEPFSVALKSILEFEKIVKNCEIVIRPISYRLFQIYHKLYKYGYQLREVYANPEKTKKRAFIYKKI